jgi:hypothetical protein
LDWKEAFGGHVPYPGEAEQGDRARIAGPAGAEQDHRMEKASSLPGKPDFAYQLIAKATYLRLRLWFSKHKVAVFVDGWLVAFASLQTLPPL